MCCWGAPGPLAPKTDDFCQHKAHPRPPGPLLPLSQQVYFTRLLHVPVSLPPLRAREQPHDKSVLAQGGQDLSQQKGDSPAGVQEWGPFRTGDMTKGFSLDPSRGTCPSLWLHPVSSHRGEGCRRLGDDIS